MEPDVVVSAGVLTDEVGRVLIAQRPEGKHQAGWWEFPGGKLQHGETPVEGLTRELREELGIEVLFADPLMSYRHKYPERVVHLHVWRITDYSGAPTGVEGQAVRWVAVGELMEAGLLPADLPIVTALLEWGQSKN